ncbi:MAG: base excision DNA repair protein [Candidatus Sulfotelmatobacter sp.]
MRVAKSRHTGNRAQNNRRSRRRNDPENDCENASQIRAYYRTLLAAWGPQHWWPAHTPFEVIVGAFLTQNTAWTNVERALANLRAANLLSIEAIRRVPLPDLERLIRPSGYFRQKAQRIKAFIAFLDGQYAGSLDNLFAQPTHRLREELLALNGIGPETADSILLYAGNHPVFVVDAYTRRILERHEIRPQKTHYEEIRQLFERALTPAAKKTKAEATEETISGQLRRNSSASFPGTVHPPSAMSTAPRTALAQVYNEMHGLIVSVGKHYCKKSQPHCDGCPLQRFLPRSK